MKKMQVRVLCPLLLLGFVDADVRFVVEFQCERCGWYEQSTNLFGCKKNT